MTALNDLSKRQRQMVRFTDQASVTFDRLL